MPAPPPARVTIVQEAFPIVPEITLRSGLPDDKTLRFSYTDAAPVTFTIYSNIAWQASTSGLDGWAEVAPLEGARKQETEIVVTPTPNEGDERSGTITFTGEGLEEPLVVNRLAGGRRSDAAAHRLGDQGRAGRIRQRAGSPLHLLRSVQPPLGDHRRESRLAHRRALFGTQQPDSRGGRPHGPRQRALRTARRPADPACLRRRDRRRDDHRHAGRQQTAAGSVDDGRHGALEDLQSELRRRRTHESRPAGGYREPSRPGSRSTRRSEATAIRPPSRSATTERRTASTRSGTTTTC